MAKACQGLFYFVFPGFPVCVFIFFIFKDSAQCLCLGSAQMNSSSVSSCIPTGFGLDTFLFLFAKTMEIFGHMVPRAGESSRYWGFSFQRSELTG